MNGYGAQDWEASLGDPNTNVGLRKHVERRLQGLAARRQDYEPAWTEISRFAQAVSNPYLGVAGVGTARTPGMQPLAPMKVNTKLLDSRAVYASEVLGNGMYSGLSAPSRPWFKLTVKDAALRSSSNVKVWLDEVERRIYDMLASSNVYTSMKAGYRELGLFGVEAGLMERHWNLGMVCAPLRAGEYWIAAGADGACDSLYRRVDLTVEQHYRRFLNGRRPSEVLPAKIVEAFDRGNYQATFTAFHAVEPNDTYNPDTIGAKGMSWRSVYWSPYCDDRDKASEEKALLKVEGFYSKPFWSPRWEATSGADPYSYTSPGFAGLADVRQLQLQVLRKQQAIDFMVKPALAGPATLNNVNAALMPGRVTAMAMVDKNSFFPIWEMNPQAITVLSEDKSRTDEAVDRAFYANLFMAITNMQGIQPRNMEEIAKRNEEQLTQLGPVVERVNQEKLEVIIDRAFDILWRSGALNDLPLPEELRGVKIEVEFISVLAQAQRLIGLGGIERTFGFASSIAGAFPEVLDKLDADAAMDEYGDIVGIAAKVMRSAEGVAKVRAARQEAQAQAAAAEQAPNMANAAKAGAETAELLFNSPGVGSQPTLADRLLGVA